MPNFIHFLRLSAQQLISIRLNASATASRSSATLTTACIGIVLFIFCFSLLTTSALAQENVQLFEVEGAPISKIQKERANCLSGWRQFLAASVGYEDFSDYWRDFFLYPSHYADVQRLEQQVNKARYAVMSAFLNCELDRVSIVTAQYYKLEAELYFLRHFVDTDGGFLKILTESEGDRAAFQKKMANFFILRKESEDPEKDRTLFEGYFNQFEAQYKDRAKAYLGIESDPAFKELGAKFKQLIETFKSFTELGDQLAELGNEAIVQPAIAVSDAAVAVYSNPAESFKKAAAAVASKFDACIGTGDNRYCIQDEDSLTGGEGDKSISEILPDIINPNFYKNAKDKKTFEDVQVALTQHELKKTEDLDEAQMRARYELLYGQVNGQGVTAVVSKMDLLLDILGDGQVADPKSSNPDKQKHLPGGSLLPLEGIAQCASKVKGNVCK